MTVADPLSITTPTDHQILITRAFDAPRQRVFDAWTKPELLRRWYGPRNYRLVTCDVDLRVGGAWRYVLRAPDGTDMELLGVYREIVVPELLVTTERNVDCEAGEGAETIVTTRFTEHDSRTVVTSCITYPSTQLRDAVLRSGMERGVAEAYDRLADELASAAWSTR